MKSFRFCHLSKNSAFKPSVKQQVALAAVVHPLELATWKGTDVPAGGALNRGGPRPRGRGRWDPRGPRQGRGARTFARGDGAFELQLGAEPAGQRVRPGQGVPLVAPVPHDLS